MRWLEFIVHCNPTHLLTSKFEVNMLYGFEDKNKTQVDGRTERRQDRQMYGQNLYRSQSATMFFIIKNDSVFQ